MDSSSVAIVCIRLKSFPLLGHPISLAYRYLQPIFTANDPGAWLLFHDLELDFETEAGSDSVKTFQRNVTRLLEEMQR
jgi:hypothetical protein